MSIYFIETMPDGSVVYHFDIQAYYDRELLQPGPHMDLLWWAWALMIQDHLCEIEQESN